jgi:hypothetical protein
MLEFAKKESRRKLTEKRNEFEARLAKIRQEEERLKQAQQIAERPRKKQVCRAPRLRLGRLFSYQHTGTSVSMSQPRSLMRTMTANLP